MDVFRLRHQVVDEYADYVKSFVRVYDDRIARFVGEQLDSGVLWPEALLQLNPAFAAGPSLDDLVSRGDLRPETARFFRGPEGAALCLYQHQWEALQHAQQGRSYLVTTGTGSGKSLTYLLPIYDWVVRSGEYGQGIRALIVYPMNALINSQYETLKAWTDRQPAPVTMNRYTGDVRGETRQQILDQQPDILLTNYVMLELLLTRPSERHFISQATRHLQFLVFDELHTYRGRQGADVALLIRRLKERSGNPRLQCIGTSATMVSPGPGVDRQAVAAQVASTMFGEDIRATDVVDETLRRRTQGQPPATSEALRAALREAVPDTVETFLQHPAAAWIELHLGLEVNPPHLTRRDPLRVADAVQKVAKAADLSSEEAERHLRAWLDQGNRLSGEDEAPLFAFRLHQFLAGGGTVYATLEEADHRHLTLKPQRYAPDTDHHSRVLFDLLFCRECGQEYYAVDYDPSQHLVEPRTNAEPESGWRRGYVAVDSANLWDDNRLEELPDHWFEETPTGRRVKRDYQTEVPRRLLLDPLGHETPDGVVTWFLGAPFLVCLRCGVAYDRRSSDFRKLTRISQTGRSTATTLTTIATVTGLRDQDVGAESAKLLSFTDNRQDASLQAGHFNDFVQTAQFRAALYRAVASQTEPIRADAIAQQVLKAYALDPRAYTKEGVSAGPGRARADRALLRLLEYRVYEDLRRGWRVAQPNLEQCGLLRIDFDALEMFVRDETVWQGHPLLARSTPPRRYEVVKAILDHFRRELAIETPVLTPSQQDQIQHDVEQNLRSPWRLGDRVGTQQARYFTPGPVGNSPDMHARSLGPLSALGRFLRRGHTWGERHSLGVSDYHTLLDTLLNILVGQYLTRVTGPLPQPGYQLLAGCLFWQVGNGTPVPPDPIRMKWMTESRFEERERQPNRYFQRLYQDVAQQLGQLEGREHTGQVPGLLREDREQAFRTGNLSALFCSPTMELGIDIRDLSAVHLRNVPPTPANYAQRSGRAGRGGQSALVVTFASESSAHDQYFFDRPQAMVSGAVAPARLDLSNPELLLAHLQAVWLAQTGINLGHSITQVLDLGQSGYPLQPDIAGRLHVSEPAFAELQESAARIMATVSHPPPWEREQIRQVLRECPQVFDQAFNAWRELYQAAMLQRDTADRESTRPGASREDKEKARRLRKMAENELDLLENEREQAESDFYPYRYLASQGFLPGYNFPRLPLQALVRVREDTHSIQRPRFLGLVEFGPRNTLYHEGRKYQIDRVVVPADGLENRLERATVCRHCGYWHPATTALDCCEYCGTVLDGAHSEIIDTLLAMLPVMGREVERITSDEEERLREGYDIETFFRFADDIPQEHAQVVANDVTLLDLIHAPHAQVWRINNGWRRAQFPRQGFTLDVNTGQWAKKPANAALSPSSDPVLTGVRPYVRDVRNVLLLRVATGEERHAQEDFLMSLAYALNRALQLTFHIEDQELAVEVIGEGEQTRLLFWENVEGGTGTWPQLFESGDAWAAIAETALELCHFDPPTGVDQADGPDRCMRACYHCLLSFGNQSVHRILDRHVIRDFLLQMRQGAQRRLTAARSYEEHYAWLRQHVDQSSGEGEFLAAVFTAGHKLPDRVQYRPESDIYAEADFYYERPGRPGVCVFLDGPQHRESTRQGQDEASRSLLADYGYRVIVLHYDRPWADQLTRYPEVFGTVQGP